MAKIVTRENEVASSVIRRFQKCKCCYFKKNQLRLKKFFIKPSKLRGLKLAKKR